MVTWDQLGAEDIWSTATAVTPYVLVFDRDNVGSNHTGQIVSGVPTSTILVSDYDWSYSDGDNKTYIHASSDPDALYVTPGIEASQRNYIVALGANDYITFDSIEFRNAGTTYESQWYYGGAISDWPSGNATNITINGCTFKNNPISISNMNDVAGTGSDNWTITNNVFTGFHNAMGVVVYGPSGATISGNTLDYLRGPIMIAGASSNITIDNNIITRYGVGTKGVQRFGISTTLTGDHYTITNNTVRNPQIFADAYELAFKGNPTDVTIIGNRYYQDGSAFGDSGLVVDIYSDGKATISNNYLEGVPCIGLYVLGGNGHTINNNHLKNCGSGCYGGTAGQYGLEIASISWDGAERTASNHKVFNTIFDNVYNPLFLYEAIAAVPSGHKFYNNTISAVGYFGFRAYGTFSGLKFKNNILYDNGALTNIVRLDANFSGDIDMDYNLYYGNATYRWGATSYNTFAEWKTASSQDSHSIAADPLFRNRAGGDFRLKWGSPCINAGINLGDDYDMALDPHDTT